MELTKILFIYELISRLSFVFTVPWLQQVRRAYGRRK